MLVLTARGYCEAVKESKSVEMIGGDLFLVLGPQIFDELDESVGKGYNKIALSSSDTGHCAM